MTSVGEGEGPEHEAGDSLSKITAETIETLAHWLLDQQKTGADLTDHPVTMALFLLTTHAGILDQLNEQHQIAIAMLSELYHLLDDRTVSPVRKVNASLKMLKHTGVPDRGEPWRKNQLELNAEFLEGLQ